MMKKIEVELTMQEIADIIAGFRPPITEMFQLGPEDGKPIARFVYNSSFDRIWIQVEGEPRREPPEES